MGEGPLPFPLTGEGSVAQGTRINGKTASFKRS